MPSVLNSDTSPEARPGPKNWLRPVLPWRPTGCVRAEGSRVDVIALDAVGVDGLTVVRVVSTDAGATTIHREGHAEGRTRLCLHDGVQLPSTQDVIHAAVDVATELLTTAERAVLYSALATKTLR